MTRTRSGRGLGRPFAAITFFVLLARAAGIAAAQESADDLVAFHQGRISLVADFTASITETTKFRAPGGSSVQSRTADVEASYLSNGCYRLDVDAEEAKPGPDGRNRQHSSQVSYCYDGEKVTHFFDGSFVEIHPPGTSDAQGLSTSLNPLRYVYVYPFAAGEGALEPAQFRILPSIEQDGRRLVVLEVRVSKADLVRKQGAEPKPEDANIAGVDEYYLDPDAGYAALAYKSYIEISGERFLREEAASKIQEIAPGIYFPTEKSETHYDFVDRSNLANGSYPRIASTFTYSDIKVNNSLQVDDLRIPIPPGTRVLDAINDVEYVTPKRIDKMTLNELALEIKAFETKPLESALRAEFSADTSQDDGSGAETRPDLRKRVWAAIVVALVGAGALVAVRFYLNSRKK